LPLEHFLIIVAHTQHQIQFVSIGKAAIVSRAMKRFIVAVELCLNSCINIKQV
jgi:hypothetical protein